MTLHYFLSFINMQECMKEGTVFSSIELRHSPPEIQIHEMHFTTKCKRIRLDEQICQ